MGRKKTVATSTPEIEVESYKGFNQDWTCRGFQYEIGGSYTHEGDVEACSSGFHAVENPLDAFSYYYPGESRYAVVKQSGNIARHGEDTKIASAKITITAEIKLHDMIERAVKWIFAKAKPSDVSHSKGYQSAASSTGDQSAASSTGDQSAASSTGYRSAASSTGYRSAAMAAGELGRVMGADGCALFLVYRDPTTLDILYAWAGIAGRSGIKVETWYQLGSDGIPVEVTP